MTSDAAWTAAITTAATNALRDIPGTLKQLRRNGIEAAK